ncbi:MAG: hypothetical protein NT086_18515 [Proteobacteria bacterium]|nr:hypothetical protein [Pseudomonadota bacterium]
MTEVSANMQISDQLTPIYKGREVMSNVAIAELAPIPLSSNIKSSDSVTISGRSLLLSRVFHKSDLDADIPVLKQATIYNGSQLYSFLTEEDRKLLADTYDYSSKNGIDLRYVDDLAAELAIYRRTPNHKDNVIYDLTGHKLTFNFGGDDEKVAARIRSGDAIKQTSFERGFIDHCINESTPVHTVNFSFLEKMMSVFSTDCHSYGSQVDQNIDSSFTKHESERNNFIVTVSKEVEFVAPQADYTIVDGVGSWRTPELAAKAASELGVSEGVNYRAEINAARIENIKSMIDTFLANKHDEKSIYDFNKTHMSDAVQRLSRFLNSQDSNDSSLNDLFGLMSNKKFNTSA